MNDLQDVIYYILHYEWSKERGVSNLRLQKLLYFIQVIFLVETGFKCFKSDIEAWDFGMVVPEAYNKYKMFGASALPYNLFEEQSPDYVARADLIDSMLEYCSQYSTTELTEFSYKNKVYRLARNRFDLKVKIKDILEYYKEDSNNESTTKS